MTAPELQAFNQENCRMTGRYRVDARGAMCGDWMDSGRCQRECELHTGNVVYMYLIEDCIPSAASSRTERVVQRSED